MLISLIFSFIFLWLIYREWKTPKEFDNFTKGYIAIIGVLAVLSAIPIVEHLYFESELSSKASQLADNRPAKVKCATVFESVYDKFGFAATANPLTGDIIMPYPTCNELRDYIKAPETANNKAITSLHFFTNEAMIIRGEEDLAKTNCQAIQRYVRAAKLFGVLVHIAEQNAKDYYHGAYQSHHDFSEECAQGKAFDEDLYDSVW